MELVNATSLVVGYTVGLDVAGREHVVVAAKGTFRIADGSRLVPDSGSCPLLTADTHTGEPGLSAPVYEADFSLRKRACDVLLIGHAYAPHGRPVTRVRVSLEVGALHKQFEVVGPRRWEGTLRPTPGRPEAFVRQPLSYDHAFGGTDVDRKDPQRTRSYRTNPVGRGFHPLTEPRALAGRLLPHTEEVDRPVDGPNQTHAPMSFGPLGRNWQPRSEYAGTYDQRWLDEVFPFLPADFDDRYHQAAPADQQIPFPEGGEEVVLRNVGPAPELRFELPRLRVPLETATLDERSEELEALMDTIVIEPDHSRVQVVWRASRPLRRSLLEVARIYVGRMPDSFYRARAQGKEWYASLDHLSRGESGRPRGGAA